MSEPIESDLGPALREALRGGRSSDEEINAAQTLALAMAYPKDRRAMDEARRLIEADPLWSEALLAIGLPEPIAPPARPRWWLALGVAASVTVAALLIYEGAPESTMVPKGGADRLLVVVDRQGSQFRGGDRIQVADGDKLGFYYGASKPGFLAVFHYSKAEGIETLVPSDRPAAISIATADRAFIEEGGIVEAPEAEEWLIGVFSDRAFEVAAAREALAQSAQVDDHGSLSVVVPGSRTLAIIRLERGPR